MITIVLCSLSVVIKTVEMGGEGKFCATNHGSHCNGEDG